MILSNSLCFQTTYPPACSTPSPSNSPRPPPPHRALLRAVQVNTNLTSVVIEDERLLIPSLRERIEAQTLLNRQLKALTAAAAH